MKDFDAPKPAGLSRRALLAAAPAVVLAGQGRAADRPRGSAGKPPGADTAGGQLARLVANENPYGPAPSARAAVAAAMDKAWQYPMAEMRALRSAIARAEGLAEDQVMIGDGSGEILRIAGLVFGAGGRPVVAARPTFTFLQDYARALGSPVIEIPLTTAMGHDLDAMAAAAGPDTGLVYICNPDNPTGSFIPGDTLRPFVRSLAKRVPVLVDEAYLDLYEDMEEHTLTERVRAGDPVIVTRTFSKLHGLAGLRVGYALAPAGLIRRLERHRMSMLNQAGLAAARASYADHEFQRWSRERLRTGAAILRQALEALGRPTVAGARGNFVFFDTGMPAGAFSAAMRSRGFLVGRPFAPYDQWCRVSVGRVEEMKAFAAALREHYAEAAPAA